METAAPGVPVYHNENESAAMRSDHPSTLTPLQLYIFTRQVIAVYGMPEDLAHYIAAGPPTPMEQDLPSSKIFYYEHHAARGDATAAATLAKLKAQGPDRNSPPPQPFEDER